MNIIYRKAFSSRKAQKKDLAKLLNYIAEFEMNNVS
jgi:hypothetical protein